MTDHSETFGQIYELANRLMQRGVTIGDDEVCDLARQIHKAIDREATNTLVLPSGAPVKGLDIPLHLLDTPANRRYLAALETAYSAAIEVDNERGYEFGEGVAEQEIGELLYYVKREIYGEAGKGLE